MPIQPPILEDQASLNAWLDQATEELNEVQDETITLVQLQEIVAAAADFDAFQTAIAAL